jgi:ATP-dependent helicase HrpA
VQRLPIERIAQASANQRKGRSGRTSAGIAIRLYSEEDFASRPEFTVPEVQRTNLAQVILQMAALELGTVSNFPFLDVPDARSIKNGYLTLLELGAVDENGELTALGRKLARLPVDPRIGRMVLAGREHGCERNVLVIAAALSVQDPRQRPFEAQGKADAAHRQFQDEGSDFAAYLKLWREYHSQAAAGTKSQLRKWCEAHFVSWIRMREWIDVRRQLAELSAEPGDKPRKAAGPDSLHRALLTGLLANVAMKLGDTYVGANNVKLTIFPGSGLSKKRPNWIMCAEMVETGRLFARTVAAIEPQWIEPAALHLVGRAYFEPHWDAPRGQVLAYERVSLFGLPVVAKRRIDFGRIDPETAREIFIREALVGGRLQKLPPCVGHNRRLVTDIAALEECTRQRDLFVGEEAINSFYAARLPDDVHTAAAFEAWRKKAESREPRLLFLDMAELLTRQPSADTGETFPPDLDLDGSRLAVSYRFAPDDPDDGVTLHVPLAALARLSRERLDWLVPGLRADKINAYLESLPKALRRDLGPIRPLAEACAGAVTDTGDLPGQIAAYLATAIGRKISPHDFRPELFPEHLKMNVRVIDPAGKPIASGRDLDKLQRDLGDQGRRAFARATMPHEKQAAISQDFDSLPVSVEIRHGTSTLTAFPALFDDGGSVSIRHFDTEAAAKDAHRSGVKRLILGELSATFKQVRRTLPGAQALALRFLPLCSGDELRDDILIAAIDRALGIDAAAIRTKADLEAHARRIRGTIGQIADAIALALGAVSVDYQAAVSFLASVRDPPKAAVEAHIGRLVYKGFVSRTPASKLVHLPRYLRASRLRAERFGNDPALGRARAAEIDARFASYHARLAEHERRGIADPEIERFRWMLEEWHVSLFAQDLKTAEPISKKRLDEQWARVKQK